MSHPVVTHACIQPARRATRSLRAFALAGSLALVVVACALTGCTQAVGDSAASGETPVTVIDTATPAADSTAALAVTGSHDLPGYRLILDEDFSGSSLDSSKWVTSLPWGTVNRAEGQRYTPDALSLADGMLTITAREDTTGGKQYSSGAICTDKRFEFQYGCAEMRAKMPDGAGLWSAFWLLRREKGSNDEADIVEVLGRNPSEGFAVLHYGTMVKKEVLLHAFHGPDLSAGFHTFTLKWEPGLMVWYMDGVERFRSTKGVPSAPMIVIANLAVGGEQSWSGAPDATTVFPASYQIDYIRVWQLE